MTRPASLVCAACALALLAACADFKPDQVAEEKVYRTGSNIAQRDHGAMPGNVETKTVNTADPDRLGLPNGGKLPSSFGGGH